MTTTLIIARHGNTFNPEDTPTRVGARTDLPLVQKGQEQARAIGEYFKNNNILPDITYSSDLKRTKETARTVLKYLGSNEDVIPLDIFNEIDYGPDENKPEADVIARIGKQAIDDWDKHAKVPDGWLVNPQDIIQNWHNFAQDVCDNHAGKTVLVVTSNGIARFAPYITGDFKGFAERFPLKLSTGAFGVFQHDHYSWKALNWNIRP